MKCPVMKCPGDELSSDDLSGDELSGDEIACYHEKHVHLGLEPNKKEIYKRKKDSDKRGNKKAPVHEKETSDDGTSDKLEDFRGSDGNNIDSKSLYEHRKQSPLECKKCSKTFATKANLDRHVQDVHLKLKTKDCKECSKTFATIGSLDRHVKCVHLKLRPFECKYCKKSFGEKAALQKHEKSKHKD